MAELSRITVLLGVTGGIAAYKVAELARMLVRRGLDVKVVMTGSAQRFITPLTFRTITGNPVATSLWSDPASPFPHISLSEQADLVVVAPATANIIAKMANGIADDLLSTILLAARGAVLVAPAMNTRMYLHAETRENLGKLRGRGVRVVEAAEGELACGDEGVGRMAEPARIMEAVELELEKVSDLAGRRVVVTAGPTREHIDPVRFISNPSTGLMGFTVAERASARGADVLLISGPTGLDRPYGVELRRVVTAAEMAEAVRESVAGADVLVMAAAVADFRPVESSGTKIKKSRGVTEVRLEPTEDILKSVAGVPGDRVVVGFAAETDDVIENARGKLLDKKLDLIVANQVASPGSGFGAETDLAAILGGPGEEAELEMMSKVELADRLLDRIGESLRG